MVWTNDGRQMALAWFATLTEISKKEKPFGSSAYIIKTAKNQ
jgi:hypothetical protein